MLIGIRGILSKEIRSRTRGARPTILITFYLGALALAVTATLAFAQSSSGGGVSRSAGQGLFVTLVGGSLVLVAFIAPALTAGAISGERERKTLDLLLVTRASALGLVMGKMAGALLWIGYLMIASLPALGIVFLFGGVPLPYVFASLVVLVATAVEASALGLVLSALSRRTIAATVTAYFLVLAACIGVPIFLGTTLAVLALSNPFGSVSAQGVSFGMPPGYAWPTFTSPVLAIYSVLTGLFTQTGQGYVSGAGPLAIYFDRLDSASATPGSAVTSLAPWIFHALFSFAFAALSLLVAAASLRLPPPRARRPRDA